MKMRLIDSISQVQYLLDSKDILYMVSGKDDLLEFYVEIHLTNNSIIAMPFDAENREELFNKYLNNL
jgi:hypothetical protein